VNYSQTDGLTAFPTHKEAQQEDVYMWLFVGSVCYGIARLLVGKDDMIMKKFFLRHTAFGVGTTRLIHKVHVIVVEGRFHIFVIIRHHLID
jgi:hypothetical protein